MPRAPDSARLDLSEVFRRVQHEMLASLSVGRLFEHASTAGAATEHHWLEMFHRYLPTAYRAAPAFVIDSTGRRSRQIDIAIFDQLHSPQLFPHASGVLAAGSVWSPPTFAANLRRALTGAPHDTLNIGCCLQHGSFERTRTLRISSPNESLIFFVLRLLERLRAMGPAPAIDLMQYARSLQSFK